MTTIALNPIENPSQDSWQRLCERPMLDPAKLFPAVQDIIRSIREGGDAALLDYTTRFDGVTLSSPRVSKQALENAISLVSEELKEAIELAIHNITAFHTSQAERRSITETVAGVECWRKSVPLESVGLYIPGGTAPLFSTLLMLAIPAQIAGCQKTVVCTPPQKDGTVHPAVLYAASRLGITDIFSVGGAQAVAAMASGTESIPAVRKVFGPGNQYVTAAKQIIAAETNVPLDLPAGPTELLIIADETADAAFIAADMLSQAEHGTDSQVVLCTTSKSLVEALRTELDAQLNTLPRREIAIVALKNSNVITFNDLATALSFSNAYAPEHLIIATEDAETLAEQVTAAGSVFIGNWSPESVGDYASGTNHTLPTNGAAHAYSGVSLDSFVKKITFQRLSRGGLQAIGPAVEVMAEAELLSGHARAVTQRLLKISSNESRDRNDDR